MMMMLNAFICWGASGHMTVLYHFVVVEKRICVFQLVMTSVYSINTAVIESNGLDQNVKVTFSLSQLVHLLWYSPYSCSNVGLLYLYLNIM